jgi:hypothetical protein
MAKCWRFPLRLITRVPMVIRLSVVLVVGKYVGNEIVALWLLPLDWLASGVLWYAQHHRLASATVLPVLRRLCGSVILCYTWNRSECAVVGGPWRNPPRATATPTGLTTGG